jgi:hypothetical protein
VLAAVSRALPAQAEGDFLDKLKENYYSNFTMQFLTTRDLNASSPLFNPGNRIIEFPASSLELQLRPDFDVRYQPIRMKAKPRLITDRQWDDGYLQGNGKNNSDWFLNEGLLQAEVYKNFLVSYSREVLLWGPSLFVSFSNPFFLDNGRSTPHRELGGADFLRATYLPGYQWNVSYLYNNSQGRNDIRTSGFTPIHAIKLDYTGFDYSGSVLVWKPEGRKPRLGVYGQTTLSDAALAYFDGSIGQGTQAYYPKRDASSWLGWEMTDSKIHSSRFYPNLVAGTSYTLQLGPTLNLEYAYNGEGYDEGEADRYFELGRQTSAVFKANGPLAGAAAGLLGQALTPDLYLLRRHYLFFQFLQTNIANWIDINLRYTQNLQDGSGQFVPIVNWNVGDRVQLFGQAIVNLGNGHTEFGRFQQYSFILGVELYIW